MKTYKVIGSQPFQRHKPGDEFRAELPEAQENRLVGIGVLEVVSEISPRAPRGDKGGHGRKATSDPEGG